MIEENVKELIESLPEGIELVAAAKTRSAEEVEASIRGGVSILGYNYVQEAEEIKSAITANVQWHMIGHLQRNKAKKAVQLFDMIETIDSYRLAGIVDRQCAEIGKTMPVLIEINSGEESNKSGISPDEAVDLARKLSQLKNIRLQGLMTMGPRFGDSESARSYFKLTHDLFDHIRSLHIPGIEMKYLSMGMSNSYKVAIEEGANVIRIGTKLFGER
ncbi:MAG: YggS family pyridoxal phosphate-dependent enzyme [candidate division KSB1 bacterium]|jgi:pyridoxal phosphate enzyme (YggS family)|nr:YggS family pyridoxal phosphate-dependent enzyme [candidate division KSB1 bacterium]